MLRILSILFLFIAFVFGAVDINKADKKELMTLEGIGAKKADAIIEYRSKNKFNSIDDLKKVKGIGKNLFEKVKPNITVDGSASATSDEAGDKKKDNKKSKK